MVPLAATLTLREASAARRSLADAIDRDGERGTPVVIDAAPLTRFDSSALAVLIDARRHAAAAGRSFEVTGVSPRLQALATLYGVETLLAA